MGHQTVGAEALRTPLGAEPDPYAVLNAGYWSVWCRACPWRTKPTPTGLDLASFRAVRATAEAAWRDHHDQTHTVGGAPADRLKGVGSAPPASVPEAA
jgi:hypothetical protein